VARPFFRHSGESRNPVFSETYDAQRRCRVLTWTPAFAGVTTFYKFVMID
jgi:hypothetical protein